MKNKVWNQKMRTRLMAAGLAGALGLGICGCGTGDASSASGNAGQQETVQEETVQEETAQEDMTQGLSGQQEETQTNSVSESGEPDLSGEIREISDQTFVLNEIIEEEGEGGTEIAALPLDEAEMNLITAVWDENTRFTRRTIKNGGADYEDSESSPEALETGAMVNLWGSYEGDVFRASQVRLTEVE